MIEDDAGAGASEENPERTVAGERSDLYYHGIIRCLSSRKGTGVVCTASGRDVTFSYQMVRMSGPVRSPKGLRAGMRVGYDLGWSGHGLRVTRIRTYPPEGEGRRGRPAPRQREMAPAPKDSANRGNADEGNHEPK